MGRASLLSLTFGLFFFDYDLDGLPDIFAANGHLEEEIGRVQPKMPVEATLNAYPDWKIPAEVIAIIPTADRGKATVKVRVALKTKDAIVDEVRRRQAARERA